MFTRVVEVTAQHGKARELASTINDQVLPILRKQPGFVDVLVLVSTREPDRLLAISIWKSEKDAEAYNRDQYPRVNEIIRHLVQKAPIVETFEIDTSTAHKVARGKAA